MEHAAEVSILTAAAMNIFQGYREGFRLVGEFVGSDTAKVEFELSEPLAQQPITSDQANSLMALFVAQTIDFEEVRVALKKYGVAFKPDDEVKAANDAANLEDRAQQVVDANLQQQQDGGAV